MIKLIERRRRIVSDGSSLEEDSHKGETVNKLPN